MNGRIRTLLAIAMSTALMTPVAFAQKTKTDVKTTGTTAVDAAKATTQAQAKATTELPLPDKTKSKQLPPVPTPTQPEAPPPVNSTDKTAPVAADAQDYKDARDPTTPAAAAQSTQGLPPTSQGAANAAAHSDVVQRATWARLDTDADGRISPTEADADNRFGLDFDAMDSNDDGFVADAEYRAFAKTDVSQGAANAAPHSSVVQRATWTRLDTDADGRISATEADADAGLDASFSAMDSDGDGFVTDAEFRTHAKATGTP